MNLCIFGSEGRMGKAIREEAGDMVTVCYDRNPPALTAERPLPDDVDVILDFSSPAAWKDLDKLLSSSDAALVTGTTGLDPDQMELLREWSLDRPVFYASNMSMGVNLLGRLLREAGKLLPSDFVLELVEIHHGGKVDSPSGTALGLLEIWDDARQEISDRVFGRSGRTGPRTGTETGVHSVRGGDVAGEHQIHLLGQGERLVLTHIATGRRTFALGALRAARFIKGRKPGLYGMEDLMRGDEGRS
jgi:4-hydroxy-tetrahydrodipicolinate reductase